MSDVKLTLDSVTIEDVNIKYLNKASSILDSNYNNGAKKELKDVTKELNRLDTVIEKLSAVPESKKKYDLIDYRKSTEDFNSLSNLANFDPDDWHLESTIRIAIKNYKKEPLTKDEIILACNKDIERLEKELIKYQTRLETKLTDDKWLLHLTFSKYCYIDVKGAAAKKVYEILSDKENHTFVFRLDPNEAKDADYFYHLALTAIDAEEV
jgi:hypothetical protein